MRKEAWKKTLVPALAAVAFGLVSAGATFALFTDKAEATIEIEAGVVKVDQAMTVVSVSELGDVAVAADAEGKYVNSQGGTTFVDPANASVLHLEKWCPGDKVVLTLAVENESNVTIKTRFAEYHSSTSAKDLYEALDISYQFQGGYSSAIDETNYKFWTLLEAPQTSNHLISTLTITIEFPDGDNGDVFGTADNVYQGMNCALVFSQEAVQGNAYTDDTLNRINAALSNAAALQGKNPTMHDALLDLNEEQIEAIEEREYVWGIGTDQFYEFDAAPANAREYFKMYESMPASPTYSVYAVGNQWTTVSNFDVNFDAGDVTTITSVTYDRSGATDSKTTIIRTNGGELTINAANDTVFHYGYAEIVNVIAVDKLNSYHEYGTTAFLEIAEGHLAVEEDGVVNVLYATATDPEDITVDNNDGTIGKAYANNENIDGTKHGGNAELEFTTIEEEELIDDSKFRGEGTVASPFLITDENELMILSQMSSSDSFEGKVFRLERNLNMASFNWTPIGSNDATPFRGHIVGNSKTVSKLTGTKGGLVAYAGTGLKIENLALADINISGKKVGAFINTTSKTIALVEPAVANVTLINCDVLGGSLTSTDKLGGLVGECYGTNGSAGILTVDIENCDIDLDVLQSSAYRVGGLLGYMSSWTGMIKDCSVEANPVSTASGKTWVGGFVGGIAANVSVAVTGFSFTGTAQANIVNHLDENLHTIDECFGIVDQNGQYLIGCLDNMIFNLKDWSTKETPIVKAFSGSDFTLTHTRYSYFVSSQGYLYYEKSYEQDPDHHWLGEAGYMGWDNEEVRPEHTTYGSTDPITGLESDDFLKIVFANI